MPMSIGTPCAAGEGHLFYDHASVDGDPVSALRDALVARGWDATVAHTGGGCMSVEVVLSPERNALIGTDSYDGDEQQHHDRATAGGLDAMSMPDGGEYAGGLTFRCDEGSFLDAAEDALRSVRDGSAVLS